MFPSYSIVDLFAQDFFGYVAGTAAEVIERYSLQNRPELPGIDINNYKTSLPMGKGLSSSAAVCVLAVHCFEALYGLDIGLAECMDLAYRFV